MDRILRTAITMLFGLVTAVPTRTGGEPMRNPRPVCSGGINVSRDGAIVLR
jgi:hypothetical protein